MHSGRAMGVLLVLGSVLIPKRIGFTSYFSLLVAGQLVDSYVTDNVGSLINEMIISEMESILGILLLIIGAVLVQK